MTLGFAPAMINHVCDMVAHHHSYNEIGEDIDLQILVEADFIVNAYEDEMSKRAIKNFRDKYFRTETGIQYINNMFDLS